METAGPARSAEAHKAARKKKPSVLARVKPAAKATKSAVVTADRSPVAKVAKSVASAAVRSPVTKVAKSAASAADRAARKVQAHVRRCGSKTWLKVLDAATTGPGKGLAIMRAQLEKMGAQGGQVLGSLILASTKGGDGKLASLRKRTIIKILNGSVTLVNRCLRALLPRWLTPGRRGIQTAMASLHNSGTPMPLGEEGVVKNYSLEVLRMDGEGRLWRKKVDADGGARYEKAFGAGCALPCAHAPPPAFGEEPPPVGARGLIKRFTCRVDTRVIKPEKGVSAAEARRRHQEAQEVDLVTMYADKYLEDTYPSLLAKCMQRAIPRQLKATLDFDYPSDFMPRAMRDKPLEVLALDLDVDLAMRFDSTEPLFDLNEMNLGGFSSIAQMENDARLVFFVRGDNGFPSLGTLELRSLRVEANALAWWDVFDGAVDLAFKKDDPPRIAWDIEVALGHARLPLPDCIEDTFLAWLTGTVMRSFNRAYPLHIAIDPAGASSEREEQDGEAAGGEACSAPAPAAVELPPISEAEQRAYDGLFSSAAKGCTTVSRAAAAPVFASASVGEGDVDHIWGLCVSARGSDTAASRSEGELSSAEFAAALHLAAAKVGDLLPGGLPLSMPGSLALYISEAEEAAEAAEALRKDAARRMARAASSSPVDLTSR